MKKWRAWYSEEQAKKVPTNFYELEDGGEVEVTMVGDLDSKGPNWDDKKDLGIVVKWLREGQPDPAPSF